MAGRGGNTFLICWGVEGRRRNGQVGKERVCLIFVIRSYFVLLHLLSNTRCGEGDEERVWE